MELGGIIFEKLSYIVYPLHCGFARADAKNALGCRFKRLL
jgi:hypothetical protein